MATSVKVGDKVTCNAQYDVNGTHLHSCVRTDVFYVVQVGGKNLPKTRICINRTMSTKNVIAAVDVSTLTVINTEQAVKPVETKPVEPANTTTQTQNTINTENIAKNIADKFGALFTALGEFSSKLSESSVLTPFGKNKYTSKMSDEYHYAMNQMGSDKYIDKATQLENKLLDKKYPKFVQNKAGFPPKKSNGVDPNLHYYRYNYYMDYDNDKIFGSDKTMSSDFLSMRKSVNIDVDTRKKIYQRNVERYNKFKIENPNDRLSKTFSHVFFVRPDCHIIKQESSGAKGSDMELIPQLKTMPDFYYAKKHSPDLLRQLTQGQAAYDHEFMLYLSNKARSFEISDEYINSDTYGQGLTGYKISYGRHNVESRTAGKFSITYVDDRDLHIYHLHKLWIDYISYVYRGMVWPYLIYLYNKILDYATCVYYIICAEDGETILFWSKYWGVFPLEAPSSSFSYTAENPGGIKDPELKIEYQYSWKEDFNPLSLVEFNAHSDDLNFQYINSYQDVKLGTGYTWSGIPFVETVVNKNDGNPDYTFKLRFRPYKDI